MVAKQVASVYWRNRPSGKPWNTRQHKFTCAGTPKKRENYTFPGKIKAETTNIKKLISLYCNLSK